MNRRQTGMTCLIITIIICCGSTITQASDVSRATIDAWVKDDNYADPPAPGTTVGVAELDSVRPLIAPGYIEEFNFPEVALEIQESGHYPAHESYRAATAQFAGQSTIGPDGELEGYVAGRPFSPEQVAAAAPEIAGFMLAWNQIHRWQYYGYEVDELSMVFLEPGAAGTAARSEIEGVEGGGGVTRTFVEHYHRVYMSKLAMLPEQDYRVDVADSDKYFYKDIVEFLDPFNVKGTRFVIERALDPNEEDQVNSYLPSERRVRRLSAKERADSFMGSNMTLDDFDGFSGRVLDYEWVYLGKKRILDVADSRHPALRLYGPHSRVLDDRWQVRNCYVVELRSVWDGHPYRSRLAFIDDETFDIAMALIFNRDDVLWKIIDTVYRAPLLPPAAGAAIETSVPGWRGQVVIDRLSNTATLVRATSPTVHPVMTAAKIKRIFSVSSLTSGQ